MIDVTKKIVEWMKSEKGVVRDATLTVLREMKTKYVDIREEITNDIQYKMLKKMKADRQKSLDIYEANNRLDLAQKEKDEVNAITSLMEELEKDMPKQMTENEIQETLNKIKEENGKIEMKTVMACFKTLNADKAVVAKLAKNMM